MKKIIATIDQTLKSKVKLSTTNLGAKGENMQAQIIVDFLGDFVDGVALLEYKLSNGYKACVAMEKDTANKIYTLAVKSVLTQFEGAVDFQIRITENERETQIPVFKSEVFTLKVDKAINATEISPEPYPEWIDQANAVVADCETATERANTISADLEQKVATDYYKGEKGDTGEQGKGIKDVQLSENGFVFVYDDNTTTETEGTFAETEYINIKPTVNADDTNLVTGGAVYNAVDRVDTGKKTVLSNITSVTLMPDVYYDLGIVTDLTITFGNSIVGRINEYKGMFETRDNPNVTFPSSVRWVGDSTIEPDKIYQFSIVDNIGVIIGV